MKTFYKYLGIFLCALMICANALGWRYFDTMNAAPLAKGHAGRSYHK
ncbi:hypothetical protein C8D79_1821 [Bacteriovorax stolpii]|nr:hypothetical protein C8D79_1821 [Bacteriovorax stolpii]